MNMRDIGSNRLVDGLNLNELSNLEDSEDYELLAKMGGEVVNKTINLTPLKYKMQVYYNTNVEYYCEADYGAILSNPVRRVFRIDYDDGKFVGIKRATTNFINPATDLATVEGLAFN